jgi:hypothetical protein
LLLLGAAATWATLGLGACGGPPPAQDGGTDSGAEEFDAGEEGFDAGEEELDGGQEPPDAGSSDASEPLTPFALTVSTELGEGNALVLRTNLPRERGACEALPHTDTPCADEDEDGLVDAWEDLLLDRLRPTLRFDEGERLFNDPSAVLAQVGRVAPFGEVDTRVFITLAYHRDYGSPDCFGASSHNGDTERVALDLIPVAGGGPGDVQVRGAYTAGHENTASDSSKRHLGDDLLLLVHELDAEGQPFWVVFPSRDKHATYGNYLLCHERSQVPCLKEYCGPDDVADPSAFDRRPEVYNAGEPANPRLTDLAGIGFPNEDAWADQKFCGGLGGNRSSCSGSMRSKLLDDPF